MRKLKLFFACLLMAVLSIGQVWATDPAEFSYSDLSGQGTSGSGSAFTGATKGDITMGGVGNGNTSYTQIYANGTLTFTPLNGATITKIVLEATNDSYIKTWSSSPTGVSVDDKYATWEGTSTEMVTLTNTAGAQARIKYMTVTYTAGTPAEPHTVSFETGTGNSTVAAKEEETAGAGITLPAGPTPACSANGWSFAGWAATAVASETTTAPTLLAAGTNYKPAEDVTLYAVYKRTEGGSGASGSVEIDLSTTNFPTSYGTANTFTEYTLESYKFKIQQIYVTGSGDNKKHQWRAAGNGNGTGTIYNTQVYPAKISSIVLTYHSSDANKNHTLKVGNTENPASGTSITGTTVGTVETFDCSSEDADYFVLANGSNAGYTTSIQINYGAPSTTYYLSAPTCCTKHAINIADGIQNGSVEADLAEACEGTAVTLTFTPATNYHLSGWTLNDEAQDVNVNTFSMPAGAATVSATFAQDACDPLATPVVAVSGKAYPYNAVKLAWSAITNADSYKVYIYDAEDNELEHDDAFTGVEYTIGKTLSASTTYKYSVQAISNTPATYCPSTEAASTFVTDALPTAHLTLIDLSGEHEATGDYTILTPFNLPTTAASCAKAFYGWTATENYSSESDAPEYKAGAEFTFSNTTGATLYAVYANETPGTASLTKMDGNYTPAAGDNLVIVGVDSEDDSEHALYQETSGNSYVKHWTFDNNVTTVAADAKKYVTLETATNGKFYMGDAANGYVYSSGSNNLSVDLNNKTEWTIAWDNTKSAFTFNQGRYLSCRKDLTGDNKYLYRLAGGTPAGIYYLDVYKYAVSASTFSNYSTSCIAAPTAEPASNPLEVAAAAGNGTLNVTYENVNLEGVTVALCDDNQGAAFTGNWLSASIAGDDKHIEYTVQANNSYNDARTAYIQLTAPETNNAATPAVVYIEVTQAKKAAVFGNLADLVAANVNTGTQVTVTFEEIITNDQFISQGSKRAGVMLMTTAGDQNKAIEIFYNKGTTVVPAEWVIGGKLAATSMTFTWTLFTGDQWELIPLGNDWTWDNGDLTYTAPKTVSSVVVSGAPSKTEYVDGEKFAPAGLTVTINYSDFTSEVNPVGVTFACDPERVAKSESPVSVNVVATFNEVNSDPFEVENLIVGDIQLKTVEQFIAAGNADMRCYLEGIVSNITNTTYGNFDLTDASGKIYVYGCLNQAGEAQKFNELGVANGDKIKVIAEDYDYYNKHEAKNVVFVSKKSPATMTFDDLALEFGDVETMAPATITLADASDVVYSIKDGSDDCVTIADDQITAKSVAGTATIVATLDETSEYVGATVEFVVTVTAPITKYAITFDANGGEGDAPEAIADQAENAEVTLPANTWTKDGYKFDGWKVINNSTSAEITVTAGKFSMPASAVTIQAQWAEIPSWAYVYDNNVKTAYTGSGAIGTITISDKAYRLVKAGSKNNTGTIKVTVPAGATDLHFHAFAWGGKTAKIQIAGVTNPSISEFDLASEAGAAGQGNDFTLQGVPVDQYFHVSFDAVAVETEIVFSEATDSEDHRFFLYGVNQVGGSYGSYERSSLTPNNYATICLPNGGTMSNNAKVYDIEYFDGASTLYLLEVNDNAMVAGRPYIFLPEAGTITVTYTNNFNASAGSFNGLVGSYTEETVAIGTGDEANYILWKNAYYLVNSAAKVGANRAYIHMASVPKEPSTPGQAPRRRVAMTVNGEQVATGIGELNASETPVKMIIDGQLFIIRGEKMYNVNGQVVK